MTNVVHANLFFAGLQKIFFAHYPFTSTKNQQKNTEIYLLHSYIFPSKNQQFPLLKNPAALNPPLPFPHFLFLLIPLKSPKSKALKEKQPKKEPKKRRTV